jgi:hypothetical protein
MIVRGCFGLGFGVDGVVGVDDDLDRLIVLY